MDSANIDPRQLRALAIVQAKGAKIRQVLDGKYLVPSQSRSSGSYFVDVSAGKCTCPDHEESGIRCKHIWAVLIFQQEVKLPNGNSVVIEKRVYAQDWPAYRKARMNEKDIFEKILRSLCNGVVQPTYKGNGRPALPLSDVIFAAGVKTFSLLSGDRATSDIRSCQERGLTDVVPHPNTVFRIMREKETVPILRHLIEESTRPLRTVEEDFAADATGIGTKSYVRWHDEKWGKDRREKKWIKLHMMIGVKTQIITGAEVTAGNVHDSPMFPSLVAQTAKNFTMREVSADMGYLSKDNFKDIVATGASPFIPFKSNSTTNENDLWNRLFAFYTFNRPTFLEHYHKRSLTESTFSASWEGQVSEVYLKVLCHNIRVLVQSMFELGIDSQFWPTSEATS